MVRFWEELNAIQFLDWIFVLFRLVLLCLVVGAWMILGLGWKSERTMEMKETFFGGKTFGGGEEMNDSTQISIRQR